MLCVAPQKGGDMRLFAFIVLGVTSVGFVARAEPSKLDEVVKQARKDGFPKEGFRLSNIGQDNAFGKLGLKNGDTILKVNGCPMNRPDEMLRFYDSLAGTDMLVVEFERSGDFHLMLADAKVGTAKVIARAEYEGKEPICRMTADGKAAPSTRMVPSYKNGEPNGFKILSLAAESPFGACGVKTWDTLVAMNGCAATPDQAEILDAFEKAKSAPALSLKVMRKEEPFIIPCKGSVLSVKSGEGNCAQFWAELATALR